MNMPFHINSELVFNAFTNTKALLTGHDNIIFDSMNQIHPAFILPSNPNEFTAKYNEIDRILSRRTMTGGIDIGFKLIDKILVNIIAGGTVVDLSILVADWNFLIQPNCNIYLTQTGKWLYKHSITVNHFQQNFIHNHIITFRDINQGIVVPHYITQYFHTALNCFSQYQYPVCLALNSIIVEGTLKDVLITRGYQFTARRSPQYISGLGMALDNARNVESFLTPADLPNDLDAVIKPIRNNLVHLSGDAFATALPYLNNHNGIQNFTLGDFINDPLLVHDILLSVSVFIDRIYIDLRNNGHLVP